MEDLGIVDLNVFRNDRAILIVASTFPVVQLEPGIVVGSLICSHHLSEKMVSSLLDGDRINDVCTEDHVDLIGLVEAHLVNQLLVGPHQVSVRIIGKPNFFLKFQTFLLCISDIPFGYVC